MAFSFLHDPFILFFIGLCLVFPVIALLVGPRRGDTKNLEKYKEPAHEESSGRLPPSNLEKLPIILWKEIEIIFPPMLDESIISINLSELENRLDKIINKDVLVALPIFVLINYLAKGIDIAIIGKAFGASQKALSLMKLKNKPVRGNFDAEDLQNPNMWRGLEIGVTGKLMTPTVMLHNYAKTVDLPCRFIDDKEVQKDVHAFAKKGIILHNYPQDSMIGHLNTQEIDLALFVSPFSLGSEVNKNCVPVAPNLNLEYWNIFKSEPSNPKPLNLFVTSRKTLRKRPKIVFNCLRNIRDIFKERDSSELFESHDNMQKHKSGLALEHLEISPNNISKIKKGLPLYEEILIKNKAELSEYLLLQSSRSNASNAVVNNLTKSEIRKHIYCLEDLVKIGLMVNANEN